MTHKRQRRTHVRIQLTLLTVLVHIIVLVGLLPEDGSCFVGATNSRPRFPKKPKHSRVGVSQSTLEPTLESGFIQKPCESHKRDSSWRRRLGLLSKRQEEDLEYERRKEEWAARYTSVDALRETFGSNRNKVWGDLDAATARRLYKTLLPRSLLELYYKVNVRPQDLAPLAYKARVAAKLYARERCRVPSRVGAALFDGLRQWKRYGKFQPRGMSYDQVWDKYESEILQDWTQTTWTEQDVTAQICFKILEKSCKTNEGIDKWLLKGEQSDDLTNDLVAIAQQLERDAKELLLEGPTYKTTDSKLSARRVFTLRLVARVKRRFLKLEKQGHDKPM